MISIIQNWIMGKEKEDHKWEVTGKKAERNQVTLKKVREDKKLNEMKKHFMGREAVGDWAIRVIWGARHSGGEKRGDE